MKKIIIGIYASLLIFSCQSKDPNLNRQGQDELKSHEIHRELDKDEIDFTDLVYVPIYSDIYIDQQNQQSLLAATLSIRNTSFNDSLFVSKINYYNTDGLKVRSFIDNPISLPPMATINYVIERDDDSGGPGANFIVEINSRNPKMKPLIQAIMIGQNGNKGFSFSTDGYSIKE